MSRWAKDYEACTECGTARHEHAGHGVCKNCREKLMARERRKAELRQGNAGLPLVWLRRGDGVALGSSGGPERFVWDVDGTRVEVRSYLDNSRGPMVWKVQIERFVDLWTIVSRNPSGTSLPVLARCRDNRAVR